MLSETTRCVNSVPPLTTQPELAAAMANDKIFRLGAESKICIKCGVSKPRSDFPLQYGRERARCKPCHTADAMDWTHRNREKRRQYAREWAARNQHRLKRYPKKKLSEMPPEYRARKAEYSKRRHLERKYGITPEIWQEMYDGQGGVCALCQIPGRTGKHGKLAVDHCHSTGRVRGLLCAPCNVAVGILGDSPERLERVLAYLRGQDAQAGT